MSKANIFLKVGSYTLLSLLIIVIIFTFGVPSFISSSYESDRLIAAYVDGSTILKKDITEVLQNYQTRYFDNQPIDPQTKEVLKGRIMDSLIIKQLLQDEYSSKHLVMSSNEKKKVLLAFLKEQFPQFISEKTGRFLVKKFQREMLVPRNLSLSQLEKETSIPRMLDQNAELLRSFNIVSFLDVYERLRLEDTVLTYEFITIPAEEKEKAIKRRIYISDKEILVKFKKDYQKNDPNAKLTDIKREDIKTQLETEKRNKVDSEWTQALQKSVEQNKRFSYYQVNFRAKRYLIPNISLASNFADNLPITNNAEVNLTGIDEIQDIKTQAITIPLYRSYGFFITGSNNIQIIRILKRNISKLPSVTEILEQKEILKEQSLYDFVVTKLDSLQEVTLGQLLSKTKDTNFDTVFQLLYKVLKDKANIKILTLLVLH